MKTTLHAVMVSAAALLVLSAPSVQSGTAHKSFAFNAASISGLRAGEVALAGGGSYSPTAGSASAGGPFRCLADITEGPLNGCKAGEGLRWEVAELRPSATVASSGGAVGKTVVTDNKTVVVLARFYREGDGDGASFTAMMVVSARDLDPQLHGTQNVWIEGVGSGNAIVSF